jgi:hypothetical protein
MVRPQAGAQFLTTGVGRERNFLRRGLAQSHTTANEQLQKNRTDTDMKPAESESKISPDGKLVETGGACDTGVVKCLDQLYCQLIVLSPVFIRKVQQWAGVSRAKVPRVFDALASPHFDVVKVCPRNY